jgi:hypothetical protein
MTDSWLTNEQADRAILEIARMRKGDGFTEPEIESALEQLAQHYIQGLLFDLWSEGNLSLGLRADGDIAFQAIGSGPSAVNPASD